MRYLLLVFAIFSSACDSSEDDRDNRHHYDYMVTNKAELLEALSLATPGQVISIDGKAMIDMSGEQNVIIPRGVTLRSDGKRRRGALIYSNQLETFPLFKTGGSNIHIKGIRLRGPDVERSTYYVNYLLELDSEVPGRPNFNAFKNSRGIQIANGHTDIEIENNELWGWSHAAILMGPRSEAHIHDNYIHHNQRHHLGYGVSLDRAYALVEDNVFDFNRHAIAGTGLPGTSYEAANNIILGNANSHSFDMHGNGDNSSGGSEVAGTDIIIHDNIFCAFDQLAVKIRGIPENPAQIYDNSFIHDSIDEAVVQTAGNYIEYGNTFSSCNKKIHASHWNR